MLPLPEDSNTGHTDSQENITRQFQNLIAPLMFVGFIFSSLFMAPREEKQVTF